MVDGLGRSAKSGRLCSRSTKEWLYLSKDELKHGKEILLNNNIPVDSLIIGINRALPTGLQSDGI